MTGWPIRPIVINDGVIGLQLCDLYVHDVPIIQDHHVVPESWWRAAGKPVNSPMRGLCPNCHMAAHAAIDGLIRGLNINNLPPRSIVLARAAIAGAAANGLTPAPTL